MLICSSYDFVSAIAELNQIVESNPNNCTNLKIFICDHIKLEHLKGVTTLKKNSKYFTNYHNQHIKPTNTSLPSYGYMYHHNFILYYILNFVQLDLVGGRSFLLNMV